MRERVREERHNIKNKRWTCPWISEGWSQCCYAQSSLKMWSPNNTLCKIYTFISNSSNDIRSYYSWTVISFLCGPILSLLWTTPTIPRTADSFTQCRGQWCSRQAALSLPIMTLLPCTCSERLKGCLCLTGGPHHWAARGFTLLGLDHLFTVSVGYRPSAHDLTRQTAESQRAGRCRVSFNLFFILVCLRFNATSLKQAQQMPP